jgi:protein TonB
MQFKTIHNAIELLEQAPPPSPPPEVPPSALLPGNSEPRLHIPWGDFHQGTFSSLRALFGPRAGKGFLASSAFRDSWVERRIPKRAVLAAALWHIAFLLLPLSLFTGLPHKNPSFENVQLTWSGPIDDLPLLEIPREKSRDVVKVEPEKPIVPPSADTYHPRQRIFTDPVHPTHPRQTLINPKAPPVPPKFLPNLPNIVQFERLAGPAKPRLQISEDMLSKHPREKRAATSTAAPPVDIPNMEQRAAELNLPSAQNGPARPKLELNAGAAPRVAQRAQSGDAGPAPEVGGTQITAANGSPNALIALSATPAPPAPVAQPPQGNLAARVSVSPDAKQPGGSPNADSGAGGKSSVGISISGGNPAASVSGAGPARITAPSRKLIIRPDPKGESEDAAERTGPPDFAALPPGAKPETIFAYKKVYTLNVNMPNLNSSTGSWILNFSELHSDSAESHRVAASADLAGPVPLKKVDPKYPPTLVTERVTGEVILYAIIRRDGSVDSIQLVRGIDPRLDANAVSALGQWKFRPGAKQGTAVELEAIVHIPFRIPEDVR